MACSRQYLLAFTGALRALRPFGASVGRRRDAIARAKHVPLLDGLAAVSRDTHAVEHGLDAPRRFAARSILELEVQVGLRGIAAVAAQSEHLAAAHLLPGAHPQRSGSKVHVDRIQVGSVLDDDLVARDVVPILLAGLVLAPMNGARD